MLIKGFLSQTAFEYFYERGLKIVTTSTDKETGKCTIDHIGTGEKSFTVTAADYIVETVTKEIEPNTQGRVAVKLKKAEVPVAAVPQEA